MGNNIGNKYMVEDWGKSQCLLCCSREENSLCYSNSNTNITYQFKCLTWLFLKVYKCDYQGHQVSTLIIGV